MNKRCHIQKLPWADQETRIARSLRMEEGKIYPIIIECDQRGKTAGHMSLSRAIGDSDPLRIPANCLKHSRANQFRVERMLHKPEKIQERDQS